MWFRVIEEFRLCKRFKYTSICPVTSHLSFRCINLVSPYMCTNKQRYIYIYIYIYLWIYTHAYTYIHTYPDRAAVTYTNLTHVCFFGEGGIVAPEHVPEARDHTLTTPLRIHNTYVYIQLYMLHTYIHTYLSSYFERIYS